MTEKEFKVLAEVEDPETLLVAAGPEEALAGAGAASQHLPKLGARAHRLEEHQIDDLRDVDPGVEHVDGDGDAQIAAWISELINQRLGVLDLVVDYTGSLAGQVGVVVIKTLTDELGMLMVASKDHGLAKTIAGGIKAALGHQHFKAFVDSVGVEQPGVDRAGIHTARVLHRLLPVEQVPLGLLVVAEIGIADALAREAQWNRDGLKGHQEAIGDGLIEAVLIRGQTDLPIEELVGVAVDLLAWGGGETGEQRIEVGKDRAVLLVNAAVGLVDDHQIEMPDPKALDAVGVLCIDEVHHRWVGGEEHATLATFVGDEIHR